MSSSIFSAGTGGWGREVLACVLVVASCSAGRTQNGAGQLGGGFTGHPASPPIGGTPKPIVKLPVKPGAVEVAFTDGSHLKMLLRDEKITLVTPHGKLLIAVKDIQRIEFAWRLADEDARRIDAAVADLGSSEFRKREAASGELLMFGIKAYTPLLGASQHKDAEVARRAKELASQIHDATPAELRVFPKDDVIYTADSMIAGRIEGTSLKAHTAQFGALQVKLSDVRSLFSQGIGPVMTSKEAAKARMSEEKHTGYVPPPAVRP